MKNFLSPENFSLSSSSQFKEIIKSSSEMNGCPVTNLLQSQTKSIWLSSENLPQEIILNLSSKYLISFPQKISAIGIYCWHAYPTNPKLVEIQVSKNGIVFNSLGNFELCQKPGQQLFQLDDSLNIIDENGFISIKIIIKETFGGKRTYINNLYLYEEINYDNLNIKNDVSEESKNQLTNINEEDDSSSVIYLRESREKNLPRSNFSTIKSNIINNNNNKFNSVLNTKIIQTDLSEDLLDLKSKELNVNLNNNNNNILTNVNNNNNNLTSNLFTSYNNILISDSELSEQKKIFNKDNTNFNYKNSTSQIIEVEEEKEKSSVFNSYKNSANKNKNFINNNINKINNSNNKNNNNNNNNILNEYINCNNNTNENENDVIKYTELKTDYEIFKKMSKENFDKLSNKINKMETEINSLKLSIKNIENNLNLLVEEQNRQNQSNNFYILEECKNMINEKIVALLTNCNLNYINNNNNNNNNINNNNNNNNNNNEIYFNENDSYLSVPRQSNFTYYNLDDINSNNNINNQIENNNNNNDLLLEEINYNDEKDNNSQFNINNSPININNNNNNYNDSKLNDFEKKIDSQIEEKFQDFSNKLGKKITDSLLKPSIIQLENFMKGNLNEVKNSLRKVELLKNKKYYKFNNIEENKNFTNKIIFNSLNTSNSNRRNNKTMFNNNNSNFNYNNNNNSSSANVSIK